MRRWSRMAAFSRASCGGQDGTRKESGLSTTSPDAGAATRVPHPAPFAPAEHGDSLQTVLASLEDAKAEDIVSIDIAKTSTFGDTMVIASGRSHRHVGAIADRLAHDLKGAGFGPLRIEGLPHCDWVLIDLGDVIVHVFRPEVRGFYNLEKMWAPGPAAETRATA